MSTGSFNFMTEIFHITQRGLHVGLMAAQRKFVREVRYSNSKIIKQSTVTYMIYGIL